MSGTSRRHLCKARTRAGRPCRAAATGGGLCFFHANPAKASALGRLGGKRRHRIATDSLSSLPPILSVAAVRDAIAQLVDSIYKGATDPRVGTALTPLLSLQLQVLELYELEQRVCQLESEASSENTDDRGDHGPDIGAAQPGHLA